MSKIDDVQAKLPEKYFSHLSESVGDSRNYVRILDTPSVWGEEFGKNIMPRARARQEEFARAIVEMVQRSVYRCDLSSLNAPDPDWTRVILGAMDTALSNVMVKEQQPTQFRFLFGQTPLYPVNPPPNYVDFKSALIRLVRMRQNSWKRKPEIWVGRFYRLAKGIQSGLISKYSSAIISSDETKMTWNHTKIIAVDGTEALVGGHNLNMDLFRSYPPVHDVSVVVHGEAAHGAQQFLNQMWECKTDLLNKESLDLENLSWQNRDKDTVNDPLEEQNADATFHMLQRRQELTKIHDSDKKVDQVRQKKEKVATDSAPNANQDIRLQDLQTLADLEEIVFPERVFYEEYDQLDEYKLADRIFSVGKYWKGENREDDYQKASEIMKEELITGAEHSIKMSQMDLISAWKKNWSDHVVCQWLIDALYSNTNPNFEVQIVVSPLDAGAGAEGDQYSFGSGAGRTFDLIKYYMTHKINDEEYEDIAARTAALKKLHIAPLYFTNEFNNDAFEKLQKSEIIEGDTYKWPDLTEEGYTQTIQQPPLFTPIPPRNKKLPKKGVIGSAAISVFNASPFSSGRTVKSAPGNHAKIMIVDDELYVVGSDNLYPGFLSEFNFLIEGKQAVDKLLESYWEPLWGYSEPYDVNRNGQRSQTD
ncbi:MAG: phospholipase [Cyanobacteria bacterium J06631_2]